MLKTNHQTLILLNHIFRFRYTTSHQLTSILNTTNITTINSRLKLLTDSGYIYRRYEPSYKLLHKPALYSLDTLGANTLKQLDDKRYNGRALRNTRRDKTATDEFAQYCMTVYDITSKLESKNINTKTKSEIAGLEYMPEKLPDAYICHKMHSGIQRYFLEYIQSHVSFKDTMARLRRYITYIDNGDWDETELDFPRVLLVCDTPMMERRLQRDGTNSLDDIDEDELKFYTTTLEKLGDAQAKAWTYMLEPDELMSLSEVSKHV